MSRVIRALLFIASLGLVDIGICRAHYHYHLLSIKASKHVALQEIKDGVCPEEVVVSTDRKDCDVMSCQLWARRLSEQRQSALEFVRSFHPIGSVIAEGFDSSRNKDQTTKLNELLAQKQCDHVIDSSTRSNTAVDMGCLVAGILGVAGLVGSINI